MRFSMSPTLWRSRKTPPTLNAYQRTAKMPGARPKAVNPKTGRNAPLMGHQRTSKLQNGMAPRRVHPGGKPRGEGSRMERAVGGAGVAAARGFGRPQGGRSP